MKTDDAETIEYKGYTIHIQYDDDPMNPCEEFDMVGKMCFFHNRYNLGHKHDFSQFNYMEKYYPDTPQGFMEFLHDNKGKIIALPVWMYEHGGITINTFPFSDKWDSGQIGYIYATYEMLRKAYQTKRITKAIIKSATECLEGEISEYDDYLTGNVYGYIVTDENDEHVDSCWGFYGEIDEIIAEAKSIVDYEIDEAKKKAWEKYTENQPYLTGMEA